MLHWLKHAAFQVLLKRFEVKPMTEPGERAEALKVVETVRGQELQRHAEVIDPATIPLYADDGTPQTMLLLCRDRLDGRLVGVLQVSSMAKVEGGCWGEHDFSMLPEALLGRTYLVHDFSILASHRKRGASLAILLYIYKMGLRHGICLAAIETEPGLYPLYLRLGFRPVGPVRPMFGLPFLVPMVLVLHDIEHFQRLRSPLRFVHRQACFDPVSDGVNWIREFKGIECGLTMLSEADALDVPLLAGLSSQGREALLKHAIAVDCEAGTKLIVQGDGSKHLLYIERGMLEVVVDDKAVALHGEGEVVGEMALVLDEARSADVRAATSDTRVVLLSQNAIKRLERASDRATIWQNLAKLLARKLVADREGREGTG